MGGCLKLSAWLQRTGNLSSPCACLHPLPQVLCCCCCAYCCTRTHSCTYTVTRTLTFSPLLCSQMNKVTARGTGANSALVYELKAEVAALKAQLRTAQTQAQLVLPAAAIDPSAGPAPGQSGASGLPNAPTPQVPLPDLAASQLAEVAVRLDQLEFDKAVLLDRLEAVTGQPQGGVWDDLPPTPPGLNLPSERPGRKAGGNAAPRVTAEMAVKSIARIAAMGRATDAAGKVARLASLATPANGNKGGSPGGSDAPEAVVIAVRRLKAERDELRKRDHR